MGAVLTPDVGSPILSTDPVVFDLTDATETLTSVLIAVRHDTGVIELAHDGTNFTSFYLSGSTRTVITDGYHYSLVRAGGWADTKVVVSAFPFAGTGVGLINFSSDFGVLSDPPGEDVALSVTGATAGPFGNASHVATFTVDSKGRLTASGQTAIVLTDNSSSSIAHVGSGGSTGTSAANINDVNSAVSAEATARAAADTSVGNAAASALAAEAATRAAFDSAHPGTITALTAGDGTASGTGAVPFTLTNVPQAVLLTRTAALTADPTFNSRELKSIADGTTSTSAATVGQLATETAARIAGDAALRTPKQFEHWFACIDQDGLTLAGSDTTGAIGIGVPGAQTRAVTVSGADSVVGSTKTWRFGGTTFVANDLYGELVVGSATNAGKYLITTVVDANHVITANATLTDETFTGSTTLTVVGGPRATRDAGLAAAKATPFKSLERLGQLLPRFGNGAWLTVHVRPRTAGAMYMKADLTTPADMSWADGLAGWTHILFRPTDNFVNDLDDKIRCGYQIVSGTNAGGYNPTAGATKSSLPCQLAGGGTAGIPLENFAGTGVDGITGKRLRFLSTTVTTALRNSTSNVWQHDAASFVPGVDVAADPVAGNSGDIFVIEESAFRVWDGSMKLGVNNRTSIVGVVSLGGKNQVTVELMNPALSSTFYSGWECQEGVHFGLSGGCTFAVINEFYTDEMTGYPISLSGLSTSVKLGHGFRGRLDMDFCRSLTVRCSTDISDTPRTWSSTHGRVRIGPGCFWKNGFTWVGAGRGVATVGLADGTDTISQEIGSDVCAIGNDDQAGFRRMRIPAPLIGTGWAIGIIGGDVRLRGIDISNSGTSYPIAVGGIGSNVIVDDIVSSAGGNTAPVLTTQVYTDTFVPSYGATVVWGTKVANTITSSGGDIQLADGSFASFAGLAVTNYRDTRDNNIIGAGGVVI